VIRASRLVEALLFASEAPLSAADLARADEALDEERVEAAVAELRAEYDREARAFTIVELAGGWQMLTRPEFAPILERFDTVPGAPRLSGPALEALAIVAYRQPVGRAEVEDIRGVGSGGVLRTLLERGLVEVVGRGEGLGRPLLYGTTSFFLQHFGFRSLDELPRSEELPVILAARGGGREDDAAAA
jgi:segregation and condensation protein B